MHDVRYGSGETKKMSDSSLLWYISDATDSTNVIVLWIGKIIIHWVLVILNNRPVVLRRNIFQPDTTAAKSNNITVPSCMPKDKCDLQCSMLFPILMWFQVKKQTQMHYYTDQRMSVTCVFIRIFDLTYYYYLWCKWCNYMYAQNANLATYTLTMALYNIVFKF